MSNTFFFNETQTIKNSFLQMSNYWKEMEDKID